MKLFALPLNARIIIKRSDGGLGVATYLRMEGKEAVLSLDETEYHGLPNLVYVDPETELKQIKAYEVTNI